MNSLRVAIVGGGPKGTFALERLVARVAGQAPDDLRVEVDVYEPHPFPGAGPVYDPRQPAYLRMNVASTIVDAWWTPDRVADDAARPSFTTWNHDADDADDADDATPFPARARVGRYLAEAFERIVADAPFGMVVHVVPARVARIERAGDRWDVVTDGFDDAADRDAYDEALLATGHADDWDGAMAADARVFPVERELGVDRVPAGSTVAVRGFALTFIDAALALTEGRGGTFHPVDGHPWRVTYEAGATQVASIRPFTRSGLAMLAKPTPGMLDDVPGLDEIGERACAQLRAAPEAELVAMLQVVVDDTANELIAATATRRDVPGFHAWPETPLGDIERSLDVAVGLARPDREWALGHAWRVVYPAIVDRIGVARLTPDDWERFTDLAAANERRAFGPPPVNAAKLVALVEAGVVDLAHLADADAARAGAEVVVDAVLPGPGARGLHAPVTEHLLASGQARIAPGRRGLDVLDDGTCLDADGRVALGLAAIGRPTEDSTIGNDTLSRALHPLADRWAARIAARLDDLDHWTVPRADALAATGDLT